MLTVRIVSLLLLAALCSLAPGFLVIRSFRWSATEKLCGSIALSLILLYLVAFTIYLSHAPGLIAWGWVVLCGCSAVLSRDDLRRLFAARAVRRASGGFAFLFVLTFSLFLLVRTYGGGGWGGDWLEHFQRTLFYAGHLPLNTRFIGIYWLPARPPMMNLIAALFLWLFGDSFEVFASLFVFLNALVFFACFLLLQAIRGRGRPLPVVLVFFLACSPMFVQNITYTWTKSLCSFFVILGLGFYLAGLRKRSSNRIVFSFLLLVAGVLVHYSAGPYAVVIGAHYAFVMVRERRWTEASCAGLVSIPFAATWFAWSIAMFGVRTTFASNTSITSAQKWAASGHSGLYRIMLNMLDTFVPRALDGSKLFPHLSRSASIRDYFFVLYQDNVIVALGIVGGLAAAALFARELLRYDLPRRGRVFLGAFVGCSLLLAVGAVGERAPNGSANVTLQPLILMGIVFLVSRLNDLPRAARWILLAGCIFDFGAGILLHHVLENAENDACKQEFRVTVVVPRNPAERPRVATQTDLGPTAVSNWQQKRFGFVTRTIGAAVASGPLGQTIAPAQMEQLRQQLSQVETADRKFWNGWWRRHGNRVEFVGDHLGCGSRSVLVTWIVLLLACLAVVASRHIVGVATLRKAMVR